MISVIIPTKNRCDLLRETLDSLRSQTYPDWEAIVVDDGSEDGTIEMLESLTDERIRFFKRDRTPGGAPVCRNIGVENARGEYLVFLDSDDLLLPHALEKRAQTMQSNPDLDFAVYIGEMFVSSPGDVGKLWNMPTDRADFDRFLGMDTAWCITGPIWKAAFFNGIGGWDETLLCGQDSELHLRALALHPKYRYYTEIDHAIRSDNTAAPSLGFKGMTAEGQLSHAQSVIKLFQTNNMVELHAQQKSMAAGRLLYHAIRIMEIPSENSSAAASRLWKIAREHRLVALPIYLVGCLWIRKYKSFFGDVAAYLINYLASDDLLLKNRAGLAVTPISCLEEDPYDGRFHMQDSYVRSRAVTQGLLHYLMGKLRLRAAH